MFGHVLRWYTTFWELLLPGRIVPGAKFTLRPSLAFAYIGSVTARHSSSGCQPNFAKVIQGMELRNFHRACHLYSAERPSLWASAHILVLCYFCVFGILCVLVFGVIFLLCCQQQCSWLPGKTVPKMTYYVLRATLSNYSTHLDFWWW